MNKIPEISFEAMEEAYMTFSKMLTMDEDELRKKFLARKSRFESLQPVIAEFIQTMCDNHNAETDGLITIPHLVIYVMSIVEGFYVQAEMNDIKELFNKGE